jgi:hypothetical protein
MDQGNLPVRGEVYTLKEVLQLQLRDGPSLIIQNPRGKFPAEGVIQNGHVTDSELLSVPGFAETRWKFSHETSEWIPIFHYTEEIDIRTFVDIEVYEDVLEERPVLWITPKGFPRERPQIYVSGL